MLADNDVGADVGLRTYLRGGCDDRGGVDSRRICRCWIE
jgi:hypothetical protein